MERLIEGIKNPVRAALLYFKGCGIEVDEKSFDHVTKIVGDIEVEEGFIIEDIDGIKKLCKKSEFEIWNKDGVMVA